MVKYKSVHVVNQTTISCACRWPVKGCRKFDKNRKAHWKTSPDYIRIKNNFYDVWQNAKKKRNCCKVAYIFLFRKIFSIQIYVYKFLSSEKQLIAHFPLRMRSITQEQNLSQKFENSTPEMQRRSKFQRHLSSLYAYTFHVLPVTYIWNSYSQFSIHRLFFSCFSKLLFVLWSKPWICKSIHLFKSIIFKAIS